jgi:hypothetical protein
MAKQGKSNQEPDVWEISEIKRLYGGKLVTAADENGEIITPDHGRRGFCLECSKPVTSVMPKKTDLEGKPSIRKHFRHTPKNPECDRSLRSESTWHLQRKALFPLEWCEVGIPNYSNQKVKPRYADVLVQLKSKKKTIPLEFESSLKSPRIKQKDEYYQSCSLPAHWYFKSSLNQVQKNLEIAQLTEQTISLLHDPPQLKQWYQSQIDKVTGWAFPILFRGDLPVDRFTEIAGQPFLDLGGKAFLWLFMDRGSERYYLDTKNDWAFGYVSVLGTLYRQYRPTLSTEVIFNDPSALRMQEWINESGRASQKAGGPLKLIGVGTKKNYTFQVKVGNRQKREYVNETPETIPDERVLELVRSGELDLFLSQCDDPTGSRIALLERIKEANAQAKARIQEEDQLLKYKRENIKSKVLGKDDVFTSNPFDHSEFVNQHIEFEDGDVALLEAAIAKLEANDEEVEKETKEELSYSTHLPGISHPNGFVLTTTNQVSPRQVEEKPKTTFFQEPEIEEESTDPNLVNTDNYQNSFHFEGDKAAFIQQCFLKRESPTDFELDLVWKKFECAYSEIDDPDLKKKLEALWEEIWSDSSLQNYEIIKLLTEKFYFETGVRIRP